MDYFRMRSQSRTLATLSHAEQATLLLYASRIVPEKNLGILVETMSELRKTGRDFRLLVVGDGIARLEITRCDNQRMPGAVAFLEHIADRQRLAQIYASCDLFVHPNPK
jgi:Glycosyltransferase